MIGLLLWKLWGVAACVLSWGKCLTLWIWAARSLLAVAAGFFGKRGAA